MKRFFLLFLLSHILITVMAQENQQTTINRKDALKIFLDCMFCDEDYTRREVQFVNYVRDRKEAQVHVMVTSQTTGSGGMEFTFHFLGQLEFEGINDTLKYISTSNTTFDERREGQTRILKLGLMKYVAKTPLAEQISIKYNSPIDEEVKDDKWNSWVFKARISGSANGEKSYKYNRISSSLSASKVTPDWKYDFDLYYSTRHSSYETSEGVLKDDRHSESIDGLIVKSLGDHWSTGGKFEISSSTYRNYDIRLEFAPGIEYDIFPYSESTRKQLRFLYLPGIEFNSYIDSTIYNKTEEVLFTQRLDLAFEIRQKWGSISSSLGWKNYFHDWSINNLYLFTSMNIRIVKGLQFSLGGGASLIHDQINLPKGDATDEEILLRRRELETRYDYFFHFSISYTFGSIFNNVVNPRFGGSGGYYFVY